MHTAGVEIHGIFNKEYYVFQDGVWNEQQENNKKPNHTTTPENITRPKFLNLVKTSKNVVMHGGTAKRI